MLEKERKEKEEEELNNELKKGQDPPDFKKVFFTNDGKVVNFERDFALAKKAMEIRNCKFSKKLTTGVDVDVDL